MPDIENVYGGIKSRVNDNPLASGATSVTMQNEFIGLDVGAPGYLTIGDPQDALPGAGGEVPTTEFVRYEDFTRNGDGTSTFSSLTRGLRNSTDQEWSQGTVIGVSIPGELLARMPQQKKDIEDDQGNTIYDYANEIIPDALLDYFSGSHDDLSDVNPDQHKDTTLYDANGDPVAEVDGDGNVDVLGNSLDNVSTLSYSDIEAGDALSIFKISEKIDGGDAGSKLSTTQKIDGGNVTN